MMDELLYRFITGHTTLEEDRAILNWIEASDENLEKYKKEALLFYLVNFAMEEDVPELSWDEFLVKHGKS